MKVIKILVNKKITEFRFVDECFEGYYILLTKKPKLVFYVSGHEFRTLYDVKVEGEFLHLIHERERESITKF